MYACMYIHVAYTQNETFSHPPLRFFSAQKADSFVNAFGIEMFRPVYMTVASATVIPAKCKYLLIINSPNIFPLSFNELLERIVNSKFMLFI